MQAGRGFLVQRCVVCFLDNIHVVQQATGIYSRSYRFAGDNYTGVMSIWNGLSVSSCSKLSDVCSGVRSVMQAEKDPVRTSRKIQ